uniref:wHTH-Hsp90 Na associated domain-containing protein n=1 Tax=Streptomyces sp. NBC_01401 TaxID=2903854 RepID=A0AAU3GXP7_9ACTN
MTDAPTAHDPEEALLTSRDLNGERPVLEPGERVPYGHVLYAAALLERSPAEVVARLTALGYADVQDGGSPLPEAVALDDAVLTRREGHDSWLHRWIDVAAPVSLRQLLETAEHAGRAPADVGRRLTAIGYRLGGGPLPETPDPRDVMLIRTEARGDGSWLDWGDEVSAGHVLGAADALSCSPHAAAVRLASLGLKLSYTPEADDELLLTAGDTAAARWFGRYMEPPLGHVLDVARKTGRRPADLVDRLRALGLGGPGGSVPETPEDEDFVILSANLDGCRPWLGRNTVVGLRMEHILRASLATGRDPAEITARLTELGHWLHGDAKLPGTADEADTGLLATVDRSFRDNVHLEHVLRSASLTGRSPADVAARLTELGFTLADEVEYPDVRGARAAS